MRAVKSLFILYIAIGLSSCGDVDTNGDLDGMWQLMEIEAEDGSVSEEKENRKYYSVQQNLISLRHIGGSGYLCRFQYTNDSLIISVIMKENANIVSIKRRLVELGFTDTTERFAIEHLTKKKMILKSTNNRLTLRKF